MSAVIVHGRFLSAPGEHPIHKPPFLKKACTGEVTAKKLHLGAPIAEGLELTDRAAQAR